MQVPCVHAMYLKRVLAPAPTPTFCPGLNIFLEKLVLHVSCSMVACQVTLRSPLLSHAAM